VAQDALIAGCSGFRTVFDNSPVVSYPALGALPEMGSNGGRPEGDRDVRAGFAGCGRAGGGGLRGDVHGAVAVAGWVRCERDGDEPRDPISGWTLEWAFGAGQQVRDHWNAVITQNTSQVTARNVSWNGALPTGGRAEFGFNGSWTGSNPAPTVFRLNGTTCTGGVDPDPIPVRDPRRVCRRASSGRPAAS
jgi:Cellulose binding domain